MGKAMRVKTLWTYAVVKLRAYDIFVGNMHKIFFKILIALSI